MFSRFKKTSHSIACTLKLKLYKTSIEPSLSGWTEVYYRDNRLVSAALFQSHSCSLPPTLSEHKEVFIPPRCVLLCSQQESDQSSSGRDPLLVWVCMCTYVYVYRSMCVWERLCGTNTWYCFINRPLTLAIPLQHWLSLSFSFSPHPHPGPPEQTHIRELRRSYLNPIPACTPTPSIHSTPPPV